MKFQEMLYKLYHLKIIIFYIMFRRLSAMQTGRLLDVWLNGLAPSMTVGYLGSQRFVTSLRMVCVTLSYFK